MCEQTCSRKSHTAVEYYHDEAGQQCLATHGMTGSVSEEIFARCVGEPAWRSCTSARRRWRLYQLDAVSQSPKSAPINVKRMKVTLKCATPTYKRADGDATN